jgi:lipid-A-disaccharide synthase
MLEPFRSLLYPLGFIANLLFGGRFLIQWIQSEKKGESVASCTFWRLSFLAHLSMCVHTYIQLQFPICLIQTLNALIAWRNLNLMGKMPYRLVTTLLVMAISTFCLSFAFFMQESHEWMRSPTLPWTGAHATQASFVWHLIGFMGILLFASRYWVQWWLAEKHQRSFFSRSFWWISCMGALASLVYAIRLVDPVNILGFGIGLVPYIRNLMLSPKKKKPSTICHKDNLFIFAGEQSGDILGGHLVRALKRANPALHVYGVGGRDMQNAGMHIFQSMERFQVMGFSDVLKAFPRLVYDFRKITKQILKKRPAGVVLIDYPDFNMRLAHTLRKKGYQGKIIHYVCPSVWAWRKNRIKMLAKTLDHLLAILPFEKNCFAKTSLPVTYVGHPLVTTIDTHIYDPSWTMSQPLIALFPGSRRHEIALNLPIQLAAVRRCLPGYTIAVSVARPSLDSMIQSFVDESIVLVPCEKRYELMRSAKGAIATSGTIILELGLHQVPTIATYQLSQFNYLIGRYILRLHLPFYTLVNIICGKEVYPEFIHKNLSAETIGEALKKLLQNPTMCYQECTQLREKLQNRDASFEAAQTILLSLSHDVSMP